MIALATTVIIVAVAKASPLSKLLSARPIVHIGVISYGIYLWHFPITLWLSAPTDASFFDRRLTNLLQLLLTIALAEASFRLVEQPIRASISISRRTVSGVALTSVFSLFIISSALLAAPSNSLITEATADRSYDPCPSNPQPCVKVEGARPESKTVVIVGDSTSQAYDPALKVLAAKHGLGTCMLQLEVVLSGTAFSPLALVASCTNRAASCASKRPLVSTKKSSRNGIQISSSQRRQTSQTST